MPTIERRFGGQYYSRSTGYLDTGERAEVDAETADRLTHRPDFRLVGDDGEDEDETEEPEVDEGDEADVSDDSDKSEGEETYSREELEAMDWPDLRSLASDSDREDVNGGMKRGEIIETLAVE